MRRFNTQDEALSLLENTLSELSALPSHYISRVPLMPWVRRDELSVEELDLYATSVIPLRMKHWATVVQYKTVNFIRGYLGGITQENPYVLFSMTRCQIELLAAAYRPIGVIYSVKSKFPEEDADEKTITEALRNAVWDIDQAFVQFLYGSKPSKDTISQFQELRLRADVMAAAPKTADKDWESRNIVTLINSASEVQDYMRLRDDYDVLCDYLHPNWASSRCLTEWTQDSGNLTMRLHREGETVRLAAVHASVQAMAEWADETRRLVDSAPLPFGLPENLPPDDDTPPESDGPAGGA